MSRPVLVTGAFGSVGQRVVAALLDRGEDVVAVDLDTPANRRTAQRLAAGAPARDLRQRLEVRFADLTDATAVADAVHSTRPRAVLHLAALIPPAVYRIPAKGEAVNVTGTANVVEALRASEAPGRLVYASSMSVYGPRNGTRDLGLLTAETPTRPRDVYGAHKVAAERIVTTSGLDWAILRLGAIVAANLVQNLDADSRFMEAVIPRDNRIHTVAVDDVAAAFVSAVDAPCLGRVLNIGGDESHRVRQHELNAALLSVAGLGGAPPLGGRDGDPDDDDAWYASDWMDTTEAQALLGFQHLSFDDAIAAARVESGRWRVLLRPLGRPVRLAMKRAADRLVPGRHVDPWRLLEDRFGAAAVVREAPAGRPGRD